MVLLMGVTTPAPTISRSAAGFRMMPQPSKNLVVEDAWLVSPSAADCGHGI
jgi:hypothetical protein